MITEFRKSFFLTESKLAILVFLNSSSASSIMLLRPPVSTFLKSAAVKPPGKPKLPPADPPLGPSTLSIHCGRFTPACLNGHSLSSSISCPVLFVGLLSFQYSYNSANSSTSSSVKVHPTSSAKPSSSPRVHRPLNSSPPGLL